MNQAALIKALEAAQKRPRKGKKKAAKKRSSKKRRKARAPKVVIKYRTKIVHVRAKPRKHAHHAHHAHHAKKRPKKRAKRAKKKLSKSEFLARMARGRAKAKRARRR